MKLLVSIFLLIVLSSSIAFAQDLVSNKSNFAAQIAIDLSEIIASDQPNIKRIFEWDHRIVAETKDIFYRVDVGKMKAVPIYCVGERTLVGVASQPGDKYYALCKEDIGVVLFVKTDNGWCRLELPETLSSEVGKVFLLSDADRLVLVSERYIYSFSSGKWKQISYKIKPSWFSIDADDYTILFKDEIFIGHHWGEFGGGLVSLNLNSGKWKEYFSDTPVTGLAINSKGELWVSQELAHLARARGCIRVYNGKSWNVSSENDGIKVGDRGFLDVHTKNWPFDPAEFKSLSFDGNDKLFVLSGNFGIYTYQDSEWSKWIQLNSSKIKTFYIISKDKILLGVYDVGVVVLDLVSGKYNCIPLAESFYFWDQPYITTK